MKRLVLIAALAVAACNAPPTPPQQAAAPPPAATMPANLPQPGAYEAISTTAAGITGNLALEPSALIFTRGQRYDTTTLRTAPADELYAAGGESWATLLNVPSETHIELRRVINANAAPQDAICGPDRVTIIALANGEDGALKMAAFKSETPPGPEGVATNLCGTFLYAQAATEIAPEGEDAENAAN